LDRCADSISTPHLKSAFCVRRAKKCRALHVSDEREFFRRPPARLLRSSLGFSPPVWPRSERTGRPCSANKRCVHTSDRPKRGWCGDCMCRQPRSTGRSGHDPSQSQRHDNRAAWGRQNAPDESSPRRYGSFQIPVLCCSLFGSLSAHADALGPFPPGIHRRCTGVPADSPSPGRKTQHLSIADPDHFRQAVPVSE